MGNSTGKGTEFDRMSNDSMDIDNSPEIAGGSQTRRVQREPHPPLQTEIGRAGGTVESSPTFSEENLARLIAQQIQLLVAPLSSKVNELSKIIATSQPSPQQVLEQASPATMDTLKGALPRESRKRRKFPSWDGERRSFNTFIREVEDCIEIDRDLMGTDRAVWYDINYSLPTTAKNKVAVFNASGAQVQWNYRKFLEHLRRTFGNRQEKEDKQELLSKLRQKESQRFCDFFPKFDEVLMGAGGESWTEDSKVVWLRRSLSESLKDQLFTTNLDTEDYYAAVRQVEVIAHRFEHSRHFKGNKGPANPLNIPTIDHATSVDSVPRIDADGDVIMSPMGSQKQSDRIQQGQGRSKQGRLRARYVDQAELTRRKINKLCVRCGTNTHFVAACPYLPPIRPATEIRATVAEFPPQLEGHPEIIGPELDQGKE